MKKYTIDLLERGTNLPLYTLKRLFDTTREVRNVFKALEVAGEFPRITVFDGDNVYDLNDISELEDYTLDYRDETTREELALKGTFFYRDDGDVSIVEDGAIIEVREEKVFIPYSLLRSPKDGKDDGFFIK